MNNLRDFSKCKAAREPFSLRETLDTVVKSFQARMLGRNVLLCVRFLGPAPERLVGDAGKLKQILLNIVGDAMKCTEGGDVDITVKTSEAEASPGEIRLEFTIAGAGAGLPSDKLRSLLEPVTQTGGSSSLLKRQDAGFGLAAAKRLVNLLGGEMSIQSTPGAGTTIRFHVRAEPAEAHPSSPQTRAARFPGSARQTPDHPMRILVVEDNVVNLTVAKRFIERIGHQAATAENGQDALDMLSEAHYDLILMDVQMPIMDGMEATRRIRAGETLNSRAPIVAMTAHTLEDDRDRFLEAGMDDYLPKPMSLNSLDELIQKIAARESAAREKV